MARAKQSNTPPNALLTYLLAFVIVFETLVSVWCFVHFGAGTSPNIAVDRFKPFGAEILMILTALTAGFAWYTIFRKRWAAYGLFAGMGLSLLWIVSSPINAEGLKHAPTQEVLPWWPVPFVVGITLISAVLLAILVSQEWGRFENR